MGLISSFISGIFTKIASFGAFSSFMCNEATNNVIGQAIAQFLFNIVTGVLNLFYTVIKWILYIVDVVFTYTSLPIKIQTPIAQDNELEDSDVIFKLLAESGDIVTRIIRALIILAIIFIFIFSIIVIIKNQFEAVKKGKPSSVLIVLKTMMKSFLFLIITPSIIVLGLIAADFIFTRAIAEVLNVAPSSSMSVNIFSMSSTPANKYRIYASNGERIPITFDLSNTESLTVADVVDNTYNLFTYEKFDDFSKIDNEYYDVYDRAVNKQNDGLDKYRRIDVDQKEYYVMADLIDYAVVTSNRFYFRTIEDILDSIVEMHVHDAVQAERLFLYFMNVYNIEFCHVDENGDIDNVYRYDTELTITNNDPTDLPITLNAYQIYINDEFWNLIRFTNNYYEYSENGNVKNDQIQYNHIKGATDELNGAVFIISYETSKILNNSTEITYYEPLTLGYEGLGNEEFSSMYLYRNQMVIARGVFDENSYPTAIKKSQKQEDVVIFYRDNLTQKIEGESGDVLNLNYDSSDEPNNKNFFENIGSFFKQKFRPFELVPGINYDKDQLALTYTKNTVSTAKLDESGELHIGYMFAAGAESLINKEYFGLKIHAVFELMEMNWVILMFLSGVEISVCLAVIFKLIKWAYDLFYIILIFPVPCATMPIDGGAAYKKWTQRYLHRMFSVAAYRFVLMLFPIIEGIKFFTVDEVATNQMLQRFGRMLVGGAYGTGISNFIKGTSGSIAGDTHTLIANIVTPLTNSLNRLVAVLFEIIALAMLKGSKESPSITHVINLIIEGDTAENTDETDPRHEIMAKLTFAGLVTRGTVRRTVGTVRKVYRVASGKEKLFEKSHLVPGSAIFEEIKRKQGMKQKLNRERILNDLEAKTKKASPPPPKEGDGSPPPPEKPKDGA